MGLLTFTSVDRYLQVFSSVYRCLVFNPCVQVFIHSGFVFLHVYRCLRVLVSVQMFTGIHSCLCQIFTGV